MTASRDRGLQVTVTRVGKIWWSIQPSWTSDKYFRPREIWAVNLGHKLIRRRKLQLRRMQQSYVID